jgi:hypothetical protein
MPGRLRMRVSTALMAVLALLTLSIMSAAYQSEPQNKPSEAVIDLVDCKQSTRVTYHKFGSEKISVKGRRGSKCIIERMRETEGAYVTSECRVPISLKSLSVAAKSDGVTAEKNYDVTYFGDVKKYCKVIKTGNLLDEKN